jgi:O-antigen biosynthesis protein
MLGAVPQTPLLSLRALERALPGRRIALLGASTTEAGTGGERHEPTTAVWVYPKSGEQDAADAGAILRSADEVVLVPGPGVDAARRRAQVVEFCRTAGFVPDYSFDLTEVDRNALRMVRSGSANGESDVAAVESAFTRLNENVAQLERALRTRMAELEAAERHIAKLEGKLLELKEAKKQLKQLKAEKQALRKSPERKVGQVLLAPYRLPQRLFREVGKRIQKPAEDQPRHSVQSAAEYQRWFEHHRLRPQQVEEIRAKARTFTVMPLISILTPVFNTPPQWLEEAVASVLAQAYENWELLLIDDASTDANTLAALTSLATRDPRIRVLRSAQNGGISAASNQGLAAARGEWIALLDHDDLLEPDALYRTVELLQDNASVDLVYSDEDKLTETGFDSPLLKPDWSPDFFLSYNYLCHFITVRRLLVEEVGGFRSAFDGAQDYDLLLRVTEKTQRIQHVARVLYHWRRSATSTSDNIRRKPEALEAGKTAINEALDRRGEKAHATVDWPTHAYRVKRDIPAPQKIAIFIPVRDNVALLARCVSSIVENTSYEDYEIVIVDNDSTSDEARDYFASTPHRVLKFHGPFNFSAINNFAVGQTSAPWLLFLNNDIEVIAPDWLTIMAEHVQRREVGAVGPRLLYPDNTIQHAGVVVGVGGIAESSFRHFPADAPGVARQLQVTRNYSAVTGACLLTRRDVFDEVRGFDEEQLPVTFNDVDLCLKMRRAGYLVVYTPFAALYHHESATRKPALEPRETQVMQERWAEVLARDPYYNPNLSRERADFSLGSIAEPVKNSHS